MTGVPEASAPAEGRARPQGGPARPLRIAVVGGGIAGLGAARVLEDARAADPAVDWHLYEDEPRFGGKVHTVRRDGFVVEGGPDSAIIEKHWPITMARRLGIGDRFEDSNEGIRKSFVFTRGRLHELPEGIILMVPTRMVPFALSSLMSWPGKVRMGMDLVLPRGGAARDAGGDGDESLGDFVRRRLGREALARIAEPIVAGIPRRAAARQHQVHAHAHFAGPAHQAAEGERHHARGHHEDDALGQLVQAPAREHETLADALVGVFEAVANAQPAGHRDRPMLLDDRRVGAALDDEAVAAHGVDLAAETRLVLVEVPVHGRVGGARVFEDARRSQPGHATADDGDAQGPGGAALRPGSALSRRGILGNARHPCVCGPSGRCSWCSTGRRAR